MAKAILLKPADIQCEYGIKTRALAYMRECSNDSGVLVGPIWINPKDTNIYLYRRESVEAWLIKDTVKFDVPELQNDKNDQSKPNLLKFQKKPTHTK
tara:strand:- start:1433 stop:1723 length:291 start_codon:yes stop_codon:yes gene_type:complete